MQMVELSTGLDFSEAVSVPCRSGEYECVYHGRPVGLNAHYAPLVGRQRLIFDWPVDKG